MRRCWCNPSRRARCASSCCRHEDRPVAAGTERRADRAPGRGAGADAGSAGAVDVNAVQQAGALQRARAFAEPLLSGHVLDTGEPALAHADGVAGILDGIGAAPDVARRRLSGLCGRFPAAPRGGGAQRLRRVVCRPGRAHAQAGAGAARRARGQRRGRAARAADRARAQDAARVLARPARRAAAAGVAPADAALARRCQAAVRARAGAGVAAGVRTAGQPAGHLADQVGARRPGVPLSAAGAVRAASRASSTRPASRREAAVREASERVRQELAAAGIDAPGAGPAQAPVQHLEEDAGQGRRPGVDLRPACAARDRAPTCATAMRRCRACTRAGAPLPDQFDDYIAKPKANGYQSLHTVVLDDDGAPLEVQIRTRAMHEHAEYGVAAHWAYKEAGARGYAGVSAAGGFEERVAQARKAVLRQLLAWERDHAAQVSHDGAPGFDDRIFVFTPQATVIELPAGATPVDFAYAVHTDLGHRCRGARVDGVMVPLNTPLANGQTVEVTVDQGGRSVAGLAQCRARLSEEPARTRQGARLVQCARAARNHRARPRAGGKAAAARRAHRAQARRAGGAPGLQGRRCVVRGGRQGRVFAAPHRDAAQAAGGGAAARRRHRAAPRQGQRRRRAGGGRRVADDDAGTLLPAGAARSRSAATSRAARAWRFTAATAATSARCCAPTPSVRLPWPGVPSRWGATRSIR